MSRYAVPIVVLCSAVLACGGADSPSEQAVTTADPEAARTSAPAHAKPLPDICTLLTHDEIEAAIGGPSGPGTLPQEPGPPQCVWLHSDGVTTQVHLMVTPAPAPTLESYLTEARESLGENAESWTLESVDGIGEFAVVMGPPNYPVFQVVDRGVMLQVTAQAGNGRSIIENEQRLAEVALPRLFAASADDSEGE